MHSTQSFIHVKPANLRNAIFKKIGNSMSPSCSKIQEAEANLSLKVQLKKFPAVIGHASSRVNRPYNEDSYSINLLKNRVGNAVLNLSVFDGHGDSSGRVSKLLTDKLHKAIVDADNVTMEKFYQLLDDYACAFGGKYWPNIYKERKSYYERFIKNCNTKQEQVLFDSEQMGTRMLFDKFGNLIDKNSLLTESQRLQIFYAFLKFDLENCCGVTRGKMTQYESPEEMIKSNYRKYSGGSTASSIFVSSLHPNADDQSFLTSSQGLLKVVVTQVGDSKIIICDSNGIAHSLTKPHIVTSKREADRLKHTEQINPDSFGELRFLNNFANTRSFGDLIGKPDGLSAEPDIYSYLVGNTQHLPYSERSKLQFGGDECFVTLITDGVTDLMTDQEIVDLITSTVNLRGLRTASPQFVAEEVIKYIMSVSPKGADNATCLVYRLPNWGNWPDIDRTGASREQRLLGS